MKQTVSLFTLLICISLSAQLSIDQCHEMAKNHYPALQQHGIIDATEEYSVSNAARAWIPQLSLSAQATIQSEVPSFPEPFEKLLAIQGIEIPGMRNDQYKVALDLRQNIWDGGAAKANSTYAKADAAEQRSSLDVEIYKITDRINNLFLGILLLNDKIAITQKKIELLNINFSQLKSLLSNGIAMQSDVDAVEVEILIAEQNIVQMESSRNSFKSLLELFIGEEIGDRSLIKPSLNISLSNDNILRPELLMYQAKKDKLSAQKNLILSRSMPKFQLFAQGFYGYPGYDFFQSMMNANWSLNGIVGINMSWNISGLYTHKNEISKINSAVRMVEIQEDVFRFHSKIEQTQDYAELDRLKQSIELDNRIVNLKASVRKAAESQLANGVIKTNELLQKITEENAAEMARSAHEIELLQAIYKLKYTTNN